jgi:hypothetical protein
MMPIAEELSVGIVPQTETILAMQTRWSFGLNDLSRSREIEPKASSANPTTAEIKARIITDVDNVQEYTNKVRGYQVQLLNTTTQHSAPQLCPAYRFWRQHSNTITAA